MICRVCDGTRLERVLDLGIQPWCNHFLKPEEVGKERTYPLRLVYCQDCSTTQLDYTVEKEVMFGDHTYLSGMTRTLRNHFQAVAEEVDSSVTVTSRPKRVLDIGSNDGTQLKHFQALGYEVLGVESSKTTARIAQEAGVPTLNAFFNLETAENIGTRFDVINAAGVFFHLEELHSVCKGIKALLKEDGVFVVQFLYMKKIVDNVAFDQIYHEHLLYYNLKNIEVLLNRHGMEMVDCHLVPIHGGSMIGYVSHMGRQPKSRRYSDALKAEEVNGSNDIATYHAFSRKVEQIKVRDLAFLRQTKQAGKSIFGMGAPVKGNTLLNYFGVGTSYLNCLVEKNTLRRGLFSPGMHIPVIMEDEVLSPPDVYYVLAWNFKKEILANNSSLIQRGVEFYFPIDAEAA